MKTLELTISKDVSYDVFENIIVTALEGGSNYWYWLGDITYLRDYFKKNDFDHDALSANIAKAVFNDPDFGLKVYDTEDEEELLGTLTQASMLSAMEKEPERALQFINDDDYDAETADVLFQIAVMGEIVFG